MANGLPRATLRELMGPYLKVPMCSGLRGVIEQNGTAVLAKGGAFLEKYLQLPTPVALPKVRRPVVNWETYPPILVLRALLAERFAAWAGERLTLLKAPLNKHTSMISLRRNT